MLIPRRTTSIPDRVDQAFKSALEKHQATALSPAWTLLGESRESGLYFIYGRRPNGMAYRITVWYYPAYPPQKSILRTVWIRRPNIKDPGKNIRKWHER